MPAQHLENWLKKGIYFGISSAFDDPEEGHLSRGLESELTRKLGLNVETRGITPEPQLLADVARLIEEMAIDAKRRTFISCWHANEVFSPRMSQQYGESGVYIRTTDDLILLAIREASPELSCLLKESSGDVKSPFHRVRYLSDIDAPDPSTAINDLLGLKFHGNKHERWDHQREWRLIIDASDVSVRTGVSINGTPNVSGYEPSRFNADCLTLEQDSDGDVVCLFIKATPRIFIMEIGVTDESRYDEISILCEKHEVPSPRLVTADEKSRSG